MKITYKLADCSRDEILGGVIDLTLWPRRECINSPINYTEWFDWSELFMTGIQDKLGSVAKKLRSSEIIISGVAIDGPLEGQSDPVRIIKIGSDKIEQEYLKAMWDDQAMLPSGPIPVAARIVMMWDISNGWLIVNDRFYEIGSFMVFDHRLIITENIFNCLRYKDLLNRVSRILRLNKVTTVLELTKWNVSN